jgi:hypothetical protein
MKSGRILLWVFVGLLLIGGATMAIKLVRGLRNNNPGNIEKGIAWKGIDTAKTAAESRFIVFTAPEWGIRAMARLLKNYARLYSLNTVAGIINRWAPPSENNTGAYVAAVANALKVAPNSVIDIAARLPDLLRAIITHENGTQPYSDATIREGVRLEGAA